MGAMMDWFGQGPGGMRGRGPMGPMGPMMGRGGLMGLGLPLRQLGLTDAQKEQIKQILQSHKAEAQSLRQEGGPAHEALRTAIENNDANAIQTASAGLASEIAKGATLAAKVRAEVFGVLTDEQKAKAKEFRDQAAQRRQKFQGMHQGPPLF
jgi:Spy/CpxP family protein refolding chaperone